MSVVTAPNTGFSIVRDPNSSIWQILYLEPFFLLSKACGLFFLVWFGLVFMCGWILLAPISFFFHLLLGVEYSWRPCVLYFQTLNLLPISTSRCLQSDSCLRCAWWGHGAYSPSFPRLWVLQPRWPTRLGILAFSSFYGFILDESQISNCKHVLFVFKLQM